ncbi:ABC transporter substrate-binding protein [Robbsia sp. Bb-Pol-6]|uniref:ABC transporter substrate-binding protein n=1 Tax=Robbsia betulipollinis TaxID=2981849 RepID=A0ABT3ZP69_9BURK|nr:ABC transporter substrate-binding protein [Robbsia betulipollinis]MCY0388346.1 ABC transporter substrate-binding protein [Robbsia betulipollinis]
MRKFFLAPLLALAVGFAGMSQARAAADTATPDGLIRSITTDVMNTVKSDSALQSGDINQIITLVNQKILPYTDFERTTQLVMGRYWRQATPEQRQQIAEQFKLLLIRTYSGAIAQVRNQQITYLPFRAAPDASDVVVRTQVTNQGNQIELDYRLEKTASGWKVYDLNVLGAWLIQAYQQQFAEQIQRNGVAGLVQFLTTRNQQLAQGKS